MPSRLLVPEVRSLASRAEFEEVYRPPAGRHLRVNFVSSLDGAVEVGGRSGPLGGGPDRDAFVAMRALADVVLVGAGTVRAENYGPVRLDASAQQRRTGRGQPPLPPIAVISQTAALAAGTRLLSESGDGPRPIVLTTARADPGLLAGEADVIVCGEGEVDPVRALAALAEQGLLSVLCEGGPRLARHLLAAGVVDELCLTISPVLVGEGRRSLAELTAGGETRFRLDALVEGDGQLMARYGRIR